ncbi:MAG: hypothetical protein ACI9MZ_000347, partial [Porticoccaceae bacterium]
MLRGILSPNDLNYWLHGNKGGHAGVRFATIPP